MNLSTSFFKKNTQKPNNNITPKNNLYHKVYPIFKEETLVSISISSSSKIKHLNLSKCLNKNLKRSKVAAMNMIKTIPSRVKVNSILQLSIISKNIWQYALNIQSKSKQISKMLLTIKWLQPDYGELSKQVPYQPKKSYIIF